MTSGIQPTFYPLHEYNCVWSEGEEITNLTSHERQSIDEIQEQFPHLSDVEFEVELFDSMHISGVGKVLGYELRLASNLFDSSGISVSLLVMSYYGFLRIAEKDARRAA